MFDGLLNQCSKAIRQEEPILQIKSEGSLLGEFFHVRGGSGQSLCSVQAFICLDEAHP